MRRRAGSRHERDRQVRTVCQECSVGCGLVVSLRDGRIVDVEGDEDHPLSRGTLCGRGIAFVQGVTAPERLTAPAARAKVGDAPRPLADWRSGLDGLAERLRGLKERHGPDVLAIGCDPEAGLEFEVGARRFARLWGTSQVFRSAGEPLDPWPDGGDRPSAPAAEWIHGGCLLLVEADLAATHPVAFGRLQEARRHGARVAAVDARFTATLAKADLALRARQGGGNLLGLALAKLLVPAHAPAAPASAASADAGWRASLERMSLDGAEAALGIPPDDVRRLAAFLAHHGPVTVITGRELCARPHHRVWRALAREMGWIGQVGGGWYPLDAGVPAFDLEDDAAVPAAPRAAPSLAEAVVRGDVRAVVCSGDALAERLSPLGELDRAELVAHHGAFPNRTWERASMSFPASLWAERDGVFFGGDGTVDWGRALLPPPGDCRSGLDFWLELARRFGWAEHFPWAAEDGHADRIAFHDWLLGRSSTTAGLRVAELGEREPGSVRRRPVGDGAGAVAIAAPPAPASLAGEEPAAPPGYPLSLVAARSGVRSGGDERLQLHPETAARLGIENGDAVQVDTPRGVLAGRASLTRAVSRRTVGASRAVAPLPALVRREEQTPDEARALLGELPP